MPYSLGRALYGFAHRGETAATPVLVERPAGPLVWLHAAGPGNLPALTRLAARLGALPGAPNCLLTSPESGPSLGVQSPPGLIVQPQPGDTATQARDFLDHWQPAIAVMTEGELRPALIHAAQERGIPLVLLDATAPRIMSGRDGWWPGLMRGLLAGFHAVHTVNEAAARSFRRSGASADAVQVTGRLEHPSAALPCTEAERSALALLLTTRPVWFVAGLPEAEEDAVIEAHRAALRLAHRLLLIVATQDPARVGPFSARMEGAENWLVARRAAEEEPEPEVQVYVTDGCTEFGLWYRLAPVTYLGGSLSTLGCLRDPMEPASLGSAILHGPRAGRHGIAMSRLTAAKAATAVSSGRDLGVALGELLAPDRSARLAHAAWTVASDGADATDRAISVVTAVLRASIAQPAP